MGLQSSKFLAVLAFTLLALTNVANAQYMDLLMPGGGKSKVANKGQQKYLAPGQMFQVELPANWSLLASDDPSTITFVPQNANVRVFMAVRRMAIPAGASAVQIALNAKEQRLQLLPLWQEKSTRKAVIAGRQAVVITGTYNYQGNREYPIVAEEVILALENEAFILHFECFTGIAQQFSAMLETFYKTFTPRPTAQQIEQSQQKKRNPLLDVPY